jgi:hypothetical protein
MTIYYLSFDDDNYLTANEILAEYWEKPNGRWGTQMAPADCIVNFARLSEEPTPQRPAEDATPMSLEQRAGLDERDEEIAA